MSLSISRFVLAALATFTSTCAPTVAQEWSACRIAHELRQATPVAILEVQLDCNTMHSTKSKNVFLLPLDEELLVGLTLTSRQEISAEWIGDVDFPVQRFKLGQSEPGRRFAFKLSAPAATAKTHAIVGIWHHSFLRNCSDGRHGCRTFGYSLEPPRELPQICRAIKKPEDGTEDTHAVCSGGAQHIASIKRTK